jgi:hypothetical protein
MSILAFGEQLLPVSRGHGEELVMQASNGVMVNAQVRRGQKMLDGASNC